MKEEIFDNLTTAKIDAKLHKDVLAHEENIDKIFVCLFVCIVLLFKGWISYWIKFGIAIPSKYVATPINVSVEPKQVDYNLNQQKSKTFVYKTMYNKAYVTLIPQAHYELSGLVIDYNRPVLSLDKYDYFNNAVLYDFGISWGKLADKELFDKYLHSHNELGLEKRSLYLTYKAYPAPLSDNYIRTHFAHTYIIPANRNVLAALLKLKKFQKVKITGELTDVKFKSIYGNDLEYKTSLSRIDTVQSCRGRSPSEIVYVKEVQIDNRLYK